MTQLDQASVPSSANSSASDLLGRIDRFNAKERFWLMMNILGHAKVGQEAAPLPIDTELLTAWAEKAKLPQPCPGSRIVAAMDYHLSWLHGALSYCEPVEGKGGWEINDRFPGVDGQVRHVVESNQEDVDFLLAYEAEQNADGKPVVCVLLVEAKGVTDFNNVQSESKLRRIGAIVTSALKRAAVGSVDLKIGLLFVAPVDPVGQVEMARTNGVLDGCGCGSTEIWMPGHIWMVKRERGEAKDPNLGPRWRVSARRARTGLLLDD